MRDHSTPKSQKPYTAPIARRVTPTMRDAERWLAAETEAALTRMIERGATNAQCHAWLARLDARERSAGTVREVLDLAVLVRLGLIACACAIAGCDDAAALASIPPTADRCATLTGEHTVEYRELAGTCGPAAPERRVAGVRDADGCVTTWRYSTDRCDAWVERSCVRPDGTRLSERGTVTWSADGARGEGTVRRTVYAARGSVACTGTYDVSVVASRDRGAR